MTAQLANPGDQTKDPTQPWLADRRVADLGTITITNPAADGKAADGTLLLLPTRSQAGIEVSDGPPIAARAQTYPASFGRRAQ